ncbi:MAG: AMP-binding protein, partial [Deltaproteobacteria bacterium]|nr:AMP-binding protein [Deltaproteobacteria bacterium]
MNTTEFLTISSLIVPDRVAMIFEEKRITYEQLQDRVNRLANALAEMGVGEGDRVAMLQVNCNEQIEAYFAVAKLDAVYVPLNFRARADEITYMLNDSAPKVLFLGERYIDMIRECADQLESVEHFIVLEGTADGWPSYDALIENASAEA